MSKPSKPLPEISSKDIERFWSHVDKRSPDECWPWTGSLKSGGRGKIEINGRTILPARLAFFIQRGYDPHPLQVCHTCDNPPCCNGAHFFSGTEVDNNHDKATKGRAAKGETQGGSKLTNISVTLIRELYKAGAACKDLAEIYSISGRNIRDILNRKTWTHLH